MSESDDVFSSSASESGSGEYHSCATSSVYETDEDAFVGCKSRGSSLQFSDREEGASEIDSSSSTHSHHHVVSDAADSSEEDAPSVISLSDRVVSPLCRSSRTVGNIAANTDLVV